MNYRQTPRLSADFERGSQLASIESSIKGATRRKALLISIFLALPLIVANLCFYFGSAGLHQIYNYGRAAFLPHEKPILFIRNYGRYVIDGKVYILKHTKAYEYLGTKYFRGWSFRRVILQPTILWVVAMFFYEWQKISRKGAEAAADHHIRGARRVSACELIRMLKADGVASDSFEVAGVPIIQNSETEHFRFVGDHGSGKSFAIENLADQVKVCGHPAIVYDITGQLVERYYQPERGDILLNPVDARSAFWNLWAEVRNPDIDYAMLAASLFPAYENVTDPFWREGPRLLFESVAMRLAQAGTKSNRAFYETISTIPLEEIVALVKGTGAAVAIDPKADKQALGVRASVASKTRIWQSLPDPEHGEPLFAIRDFIQNPGGAWLFITSRADQHDFLKPLISLWCDIAAKALLSLRPDPERRLWVLLDEVASLEMLPALNPLLNQGRKYGACVVIGLQNVAQLRESYKEGAITLLSAPQTTLTLGTREPETAQWLADALGKEEISEAKETVSFPGDSSTPGSVQLTRERTEKYIVTKDEIQYLPKLRGFLQLRGYPVAEVEVKVPKKIIVAEQFVPRLKKVI